MNPNSVLPSISVSKSADSTDEHKHRRVFVGPMPERVAFNAESHERKRRGRKLFRVTSHGEEDDTVSQVIKDHAFHFFINEGGKQEEWGENEEQSIREEMLKRWRESAWGATWARRDDKETRPASYWVGGSFEVGQFLGVNVLPEPDGGARDRISSFTSQNQNVSFSASNAHVPMSQSASGRDTYFTAPTQPAGTTQTLSPNMNGSDGEGHTTTAESINSSTALLPGPAQYKARPRSEAVLRPKFVVPNLSAKSDGQIDASKKGKGRAVHYPDSPIGEEPGPALPSEVLQRTGTAVEDSSAGASYYPHITQWGDVVMRDRMLVRKCYSRSDIVERNFDETKNRTTKNLQYEGWREFMVIWRKDRIEIYDDYSIPCKERIMGHKHLAFVIPLKSSKTQLSIYSFVDLTFCITCPPAPIYKTSKARNLLHHARGTNIFIFKVKSRSRAYDWTWQLWRHLDGRIPQVIDVWNPGLNTKVKIGIPCDQLDAAQIYKTFSRQNIMALCIESLRSVGDWKSIIERQIMAGKSLELAWRVDTTLDWIWLKDDVNGERRQWEVLCGLVLRQSTRPALLEIRLAEHFPAHLHLKNGSRLHEPPAIEGYLDRIKPNTQIKQSTYISTHDGNLFLLAPARAHPPTPPGLSPPTGDPETDAKTLHLSEVQRGAMQIMDATGVSDLRCILAVRRAFHTTVQHSHKEASELKDHDVWLDIWSQSEHRTDSDNEDEGGDEGLSKAKDKPRQRMKRSFELLLNSGRIIRFEAHSRHIAVEWIERLRALVLYWKQRHRIDAREEMDLAQSRRPRLTPFTRVNAEDCEFPPDSPPDLMAPLPALSSLFSWCVLDGCKSVIRGGKVYMRRGLRGQYKLVQLFLIPGHLVQFRIKPQSALHSSMHKATNLVDAYVCSGYFAALALPQGQYNPTVAPAPRRYQDGLEADDPEEDMLFVIWFRPQAPKVVETTDTSTGQSSGAPKTVPALSAKRKMLVCRTRSKLERDAWCWALNCEIEKVVRAQKEREERLRETGNLKV